MEKQNTAEMNKYVTFVLDNETFALEINKVREVLDVAQVTRVPQTPAFLRGIINLRGSVVPVVDLRLKFGLSRTEDTVNTRIIIMEVDAGEGVSLLGALADSVREVIELEESQIGPPPRIGTLLSTEFIKCMGRKNDEFIIILDIDRVFNLHELASVRVVEEEMANRMVAEIPNAPMGAVAET